MKAVTMSKSQRLGSRKTVAPTEIGIMSSFGAGLFDFFARPPLGPLDNGLTQIQLGDCSLSSSNLFETPLSGLDLKDTSKVQEILRAGNIQSGNLGFSVIGASPQIQPSDSSVPSLSSSNIFHSSLYGLDLKDTSKVQEILQAEQNIQTPVLSQITTLASQGNDYGYDPLGATLLQNIISSTSSEGHCTKKATRNSDLSVFVHIEDQPGWQCVVGDDLKGPVCYPASAS